MPTNANTFNSRVTSEALEAKFRQVFPAQGGAELVQDLFASGVIQPVIDFSSVAEGSVLSQNLQTAWDFATGQNSITATSPQTIINNTGFWKVDLTLAYRVDSGPGQGGVVDVFDGTTAKQIWAAGRVGAVGTFFQTLVDGSFVVYLRAGDSLRANVGSTAFNMDIWYRQIADVNGNLVNPLGFTFS
jgi:hypothetical protein